MPGENEIRTNNSKNNQEGNAKGKLSPELVRQVAERVYTMLRDELLLERERARTNSNMGPGEFRR